MRYHAPYGVTDPNAPYINGDPSIGQAGSIPPAQSIEFPQREIVNLIDKGGLIPDDADLYQLTRGVRRGKYAYGVDTGSQNAPSIALDPPLTAMAAAGTEIRVRLLFTNSAACSITINGLPPTPILHADGTTLNAGDLHANGIAVLVSDGTNWQLTNSLGGSVIISGGSSTGIPYGVDTGTANHIIATCTPTITSLYPGLAALVKVSNNVTGATDFKPDGLAVKTVRWPNGAALVNGDGVAGGVMLLCYDGAVWQLLNFTTHPTTGGASSTMDPGDIIMWPLETAKPLTFECNGQAISRTTYANLFAKIGTTHGVGDGSTTFNVPDYQGFFLRGWSHGTGSDPDAGSRTNRGDGVTGDHVGTAQGDNYRSHGHSLSGQLGNFAAANSSGDAHTQVDVWNGNSMPGSDGYVVLSAAATDRLDLALLTVIGNANPTGGNESRPKNKSIMFCIAY